jgi:hypothetical protein
MVISTSRLAYSDCFDLMDKAIADPKGIKIKFGENEEAWHFRIRLHTARKIDRKENRDIYDQTHPLHGRSVYDQLTMRIRKVGDHAWLRLERIDARVFEVESLTEPEADSEALTQTAMIKGTKTKEHQVEPIRRMLRRI